MVAFIPFQYFPVKELVLVSPRVISIAKSFQAFKKVHARVIPHPAKHRLLHLQTYMPVTVATRHNTLPAYIVPENEFPLRFYYVTKITNIIQIHASLVFYVMFFNGTPQEINNPPYHSRVANPASLYSEYPVIRDEVGRFYPGALHEVAVFWLVSISGLSSSGI